MRRIASASGAATERTVSLSVRLAGSIGTVLVQTIPSTSFSAESRAIESPVNRPCVQATRTLLTCRSRSRSSSSNTVLPLAISSSSTITSRSVTSPMTELITTLSSAYRCLAPTATSMPSIRANAAASLALPRSGETTTVLLRSYPRK
jgi:hypothetical protein